MLSSWCILWSYFLICDGQLYALDRKHALSKCDLCRPGTFAQFSWNFPRVDQGQKTQGLCHPSQQPDCWSNCWWNLMPQQQNPRVDAGNMHTYMCKHVCKHMCMCTYKQGYVHFLLNCFFFTRAFFGANWRLEFAFSWSHQKCITFYCGHCKLKAFRIFWSTWSFSYFLFNQNVFWVDWKTDPWKQKLSQAPVVLALGQEANAFHEPSLHDLTQLGRLTASLSHLNPLNNWFPWFIENQVK